MVSAAHRYLCCEVEWQFPNLIEPSCRDKAGKPRNDRVLLKKPLYVELELELELKGQHTLKNAVG
jgi:hypothetical protein